MITKYAHKMDVPIIGVSWQLRRIGGPASVQNSSSLIILKEDGSVSVGRGPKADYFLDSAVTSRLISRVHALVTGRNGKDGTPSFTIVNNGLNGTYINDVKMGYRTAQNEQVLQEGDKITFGHPGCASIEPGEYAPQENSEFMFIFECVPARGVSDGYLSKASLKHSTVHSAVHTTHQKHTTNVSKCAEHNTHVSRYQRDRYSITGHTESKQHSGQIRVTGSKVTGSDSGPESPKSSASSEKENDGTVGRVTSAGRDGIGGAGDSENAKDVYSSRLDLSPHEHEHSCKYCCVSVSPGSAILTGKGCVVCDAKPKSRWPPDHKAPTGVANKNSIWGRPDRMDADGEHLTVVSGTEHTSKSGPASKATSLTIGHHGCSRPLRNGTPMSCDENYVSSTNQNRTPDRTGGNITGGSTGRTDRIPPTVKPHNDLQTFGNGSEVNSTTLVTGENYVSDDSDIEIDVIKVDDDADLAANTLVAGDRTASPVVEYLGETGPTMPLRMVTPPDMTTGDKEMSISTTTPSGSESAIKGHQTSITSTNNSCSSSGVIASSIASPKDNRKRAKGSKKSSVSQAMQPGIFPLGNHVKKTDNISSLNITSVPNLSQTSKLTLAKSKSEEKSLKTTSGVTNSSKESVSNQQGKISTTIHHTQRQFIPLHLALQEQTSPAVPSQNQSTPSSAMPQKSNTPPSTLIHAQKKPSLEENPKQKTPTSFASYEKCTLSPKKLLSQNPGLPGALHDRNAPSAPPKEGIEHTTSASQKSPPHAFLQKDSRPTKPHSVPKVVPVTCVSSRSFSPIYEKFVYSHPSAHKHCKDIKALIPETKISREHHRIVPHHNEHLKNSPKGPSVTEANKICSNKEQAATFAVNIPKPVEQEPQSHAEPPPGIESLSGSPLPKQDRMVASPAVHETEVRLSSPRPSSCSSSSGLDISTGETHLSHHQHHLHHLHRRPRYHQHHRRNSSPSSGSAPSSRSSSDTSCDRRSSLTEGSRDDSFRSFRRCSDDERNEDGGLPRNVGKAVNVGVVFLKESISRRATEEACSPPCRSTDMNIQGSCETPTVGDHSISSNVRTDVLPRRSTPATTTRSSSQSSEASGTSSSASSSSSSSSASSSSSSSMSSSSSYSSTHQQCNRNPPLSGNACNEENANKGCKNSDKDGDNKRPKPCLALERRLHTGRDNSNDRQRVEGKRRDEGGGRGGTTVNKTVEISSSPMTNSTEKTLDVSLNFTEKTLDMSVNSTEKPLDMSVNSTEKSLDMRVNSTEKSLDMCVDSTEKPLDMSMKKEAVEKLCPSRGNEVVLDVKEKKAKPTIVNECLDKLIKNASETENKMATTENSKCTCHQERKNPKDSRRCKEVSHCIRKSRAVEYMNSHCARYNKMRTEMDVLEMARLARSSTIIIDSSPRLSSPSSPVHSDSDASSLSSLSSTSSSSSSSSSSTQRDRHRSRAKPRDQIKPATGESNSVAPSHLYKHENSGDKNTRIPTSHSQTSPLPHQEPAKTQDTSNRTLQNRNPPTQSSAKPASHISDVCPLRQGTNPSVPLALGSMSALSVDVGSDNSLPIPSTHFSDAPPSKVSPSSSASSSSSSSPLSSPSSLPSPTCSTQTGKQQRQNVISPSKKKRSILPPRKYVPQLRFPSDPHPTTAPPSSKSPVSKPAVKQSTSNRKPEKLSHKPSENKDISPETKIIPKTERQTSRPFEPTTTSESSLHLLSLPPSSKFSSKPGENKDISPKTKTLPRPERQTSGPFEPTITSESSLHLLSLPSSSKKLSGPSSPLSLDSDKSGSLPPSPVMRSSQSTPPPLEVGPCDPPSTRKSQPDLPPPKLEPEIWGRSKLDKKPSDSKQVKPSAFKPSSSYSANSLVGSESTSKSSTNSFHDKPLASAQSAKSEQIPKPSKKTKRSAKRDQTEVNQSEPSTSSVLTSSHTPMISLERLSDTQLKQTGENTPRKMKHSQIAQAPYKIGESESSTPGSHRHSFKVSESTDKTVKVSKKISNKSKTGLQTKNISSLKENSTLTLFSMTPAVTKKHHVHDTLCSSPNPTISLSRLSEAQVREAGNSPRHARTANTDRADTDSINNTSQSLSSSSSSSSFSSKFETDNPHDQDKFQSSSSQLDPHSRKHINCKTRPFPSKVKQPQNESDQASFNPSLSRKSEPETSNTFDAKKENLTDSSEMVVKKSKGSAEKISKISVSEYSQNSMENKISSNKLEPGKTEYKTDKTTGKKTRKFKDILKIDNDLPPEKPWVPPVKKEKVADFDHQFTDKSKDEIPPPKSKQKTKKAEKITVEINIIKNSKDTDQSNADVYKKDQDDKGVKPSALKEKASEKAQPAKKSFGSQRKPASTTDAAESRSTRLSLFECLEIQAQQTKAQRKKPKKSEKPTALDKINKLDKSLPATTSQKQSAANKYKPEPKRRQNSSTPRRCSSRNSGRFSVASVSSEDSYNFGSRRLNRSAAKTLPDKKKRKLDDSVSAERKLSEERKLSAGEGVRTKAKAKAAAASKKMLTEKDVMSKKKRLAEKLVEKKQEKRKIASSEEETDIKETPSPAKKKKNQADEPQNKKITNKKKPTRKRKRAMTVSSGDEDDTMNDLSDDESELDDIVDNIEDYNSVEDGGDSEDWDLPDGVNYDDTPCSAPRCRNPIGERVDWVMCDSCEQWYHVACVNCSVDQLEDDNIQFHCGFC